MKKSIIILMFSLPLLCVAQSILPREYDYDAAGNRTLRKTILISSPQSPPVPNDSLQVTSYELQVTSDELQELALAQFFVENIAQVEFKIYPNPTTEKITLEISNMDNLQTGNFKLYNLDGRLLQEQLVHSAISVISLANLPKGAYILNVHINGKTEDWKVIKN